MSIRIPRRSTRSQSREASVAASEEASDASSVGTTASQRANGNVRTRKAGRTVGGKAKKPDAIAEDEPAFGETEIVGSDAVISQKEESEHGEKDLHLASPVGATTSKPKTVRRKLVQSIQQLVHLLPLLPPLLTVSSLVLALLLLSPNKPFARKVYVDENALQPGSASVEWGWNQVEFADRVAERIAMVADSPANVRAALLSRELQTIGLTAHNQSFSFEVPSKEGPRRVGGINTYAHFPAARGDGREAFVLAASWKSAWDGTNDPDVEEAALERADLEGGMGAYERARVRRSNVRGIATTLTLARHLSGFRHWSKDLIFVFGDGEMEGIQAWTSAYFGRDQSNLRAERLHCGGPAIWNALAIDYPSDSFSHVVIKHEGLQGQLPNMDVINAFTRIAQRTNGLPVSLSASSDHDPRWGRQPLGEVGSYLERHLWKDSDGAKKYLSGLLNVASQVAFLSSGQPSGIHGLFHRYHVDAITLFLHPAPGPYGFYHLGRAVESMTRSMSNLLERLHHSQFFYLLTSPYRFIEVAKYLPVAGLLSAALTLAGISLWIDEGRRAYLRQSALVDIVRAAIQDEQASDWEDNRAPEPPRFDVGLERPTTAQLLSSFVALLVQRSQERGELLGTTKLRSAAALMQLLGRPVGPAVAVALVCHLVGAYAYYVATRAPIDCASAGVEQCKPLRLLSLVSTLSALLLVWRIRRANAGLLWRRIQACQSPLPPAVVATLTSFQAFRIRAIARTVHTFALLEAGLLILAISLVNFSLALVLGVIVCIPLCTATLPVSSTMSPDDPKPDPTLSRPRSVSPASNDTDNVEALLPSLPTTHALPLQTKASLTLQAGLFFALAPQSLVYLATGLAHLACRFGNHACTVPPRLDSFFDQSLYHHHILGTLTLPFLTLFYLPLVLLASVANILAIG